MTRDQATGIAYDASTEALCRPGQLDNFFQLHQPRSPDALAAEMSRLAYCDFDRHLSPALARVGYQLVGAPFETGGTEAFLAAGEDRALLAFRGSDDLKAWITNIDARLQPWRGAGRVHSGFGDALEQVWTALEARVKALKQPLVITGHSQGGALASLAASLLPGAELVTFGSPRVGDQDFAAGLNAARRYVDNRDLVCRLPLAGVPLMADYRHHGRLHFIDPEGDVSLPNDPTTAERLGFTRETVMESLAHLRQSRLPRHLSDHAPINYVSALQ